VLATEENDLPQGEGACGKDTPFTPQGSPIALKGFFSFADKVMPQWRFPWIAEDQRRNASIN